MARLSQSAERTIHGLQDIKRDGSTVTGAPAPPPSSTSTAATMSHGDQGKQWLPVLDVGPFLANDPGALEALAAELRVACEGVGFYFLENTEAILPDEVVRGMLEASRRVHSAPTALKESLYLDQADSGYMPVGSNTRWGSDGQPTLPVYEGVNEGYLLWGYGPPWAKEENQLATLEDNQWPAESTLPGFTDAIQNYTRAVDSLARAMLPVCKYTRRNPHHILLPRDASERLLAFQTRSRSSSRRISSTRCSRSRAGACGSTTTRQTRRKSRSASRRTPMVISARSYCRMIYLACPCCGATGASRATGCRRRRGASTRCSSTPARSFRRVLTVLIYTNGFD